MRRKHYNASVTQSFIIEKELSEPGIQRLYDRKKEELRASHIFFRLKPNATPDDTLMAYIRAMNVIEQIPTVPFDTLVVHYSEDPSAKANFGDLGFFSAGKMVPEFEDACYSLKVGECTKTPIRSQFGYHVIKLTARQPNSGSAHISHILLRFNKNRTDTAAVRDTIWMIYNKLKSGANFGDMAQRYSQDQKSALLSGDMGFYERGRIPPVIADVIYNLKIDSITEPMRFNYGYHIFKLTGFKKLPSFAEMQKELNKQYNDLVYWGDYKKYTEGLKALYHVSIDSPAVRKLISSVDTTKMSGKEGWKDTLSAEVLKMTIIHSVGRPFTVNDFAEKVLTVNDYKNYLLTPKNIWSIVNKLLDDVALEEHARHAMEKYPSLVKLLKEYEEGLLLYRIEQDEVWKKVFVNDSLLREYYNAHKEEYRWPERVNFAEINTIADSTIKAAYWKVRYGEDFLDVAQEYTNRLGYKEKKGIWGFQPYDLNDLSRKASAMAIDSVSEPFRYLSGWSIVKTLAKDTVHIKSFEDAAPEVASGYQEVASKQREQEWIETLQKKYSVKINKELLAEAFKRKRVESQ